MKTNIYIITIIAALSWNSLGFAQEVLAEPTDAVVSEAVLPTEDAKTNESAPSEGQISVSQEDSAPTPAATSYLIPEDPVDTAPASTEENLQSEEIPAVDAQTAPAVDAQMQEEAPAVDAQMQEEAPAVDAQMQEEAPAVEAQMQEEAPAEDAQIQTESNEPDNALQVAEGMPSENPQEQPDASEDVQPQTGWRSGLAPYIGIGPAFDLRDSAAGYSARLGLDIHWNYVGIGLEVTWNMIWAKDGTKRSDHNDVAYRTTNSGLLAMLHGYIPLTDHLLVTLGAGIGLGKRYEITFSDHQSESFNSQDTSWLSRLQAGVLWLFENNFTLGLDMEFNFGGYTDPHEVWWSDKEDDISLGLVLTVSYQYMD